MGAPKLSKVAEKVRTKFWLLQNVSFCILLGAFIGIGYFLLIESNLGGNYTKFWVYGASALVTLFASGVALVGVFSNIENQNKLADDAFQAKKRASIAMLPIVLAEIGRRCEHNVFTVLINSDAKLRSCEEMDNHFQKYQNAEILPLTGDKEFQTLKECIEYSREASAKILSRIILQYQIAYSRTHEKDFPKVQKDYLGRVIEDTSFQRAQDWLLLHSLTSHCLRYARGLDEDIPVFVDTWRIAQNLSASRQDRCVRIPPIVQDFENFHNEFATHLTKDLAFKVDQREVIDIKELIELGVF